MNREIEVRLQQAMKNMGLQEVKVTCDQPGCVELTGTVANFDECALASALALTTPGVSSVSNKLRVP